ncbi:MAG: hypothetical protein A2X47_03950 [Lentisphaerae bacterium GWF2_38_69]|nr:MAG: hypothetical protein A2X47_03950 [Lentisphaerae bacterium GWF2_38_69]
MTNKPAKRWIFTGRKPDKFKADDSLKERISKMANELIDKKLKPEYVKESNVHKEFNYIVDLYSKWVSGRFYLCAKYRCPSERAISEFFESKFARIEVVSPDNFNLSYMRYTGQWIELYPNITIEECFLNIETDPWFQP